MHWQLNREWHPVAGMARGCGLKTKLFWQLAVMEEWKPEEYSCLKLSNVTLFR